MKPPQAAAGLELHYQAESKGGAPTPTPPGLLRKQHVQAEVKRLAGLRIMLGRSWSGNRWDALQEFISGKVHDLKVI